MKKLVLMFALFTAFNCLADGAAIYNKGCVICHGQDGKQVYLGKVPALAGQAVEDLTTKLTSYKNGELNVHGMGQLMTAQTNMHLKTDEDIQAVAEYISQL